MSDSVLVYSTEAGRVCPKCGRPKAKCICRKGKQGSERKADADGIIRIKREKKGRKGKTVTTISGFRENAVEQKKIASRLKNLCGTGGSVKDGVIVIQGDHRETVKNELVKQGFEVKLAGG